MNSDEKPAESATEALAVLAPALTFDELLAAISRFTRERAPNNPGEAVAFAFYMTGLAAAILPSLTAFITTLVPPPADGDVVN